MGNTTQAGQIQNNKITFLRDKYMKSFGNVKIYEVKHFNKQVVGIPCLLPVSDPQKRIDLRHPNLLNALAFEHQFMEVFALSSNNLIYFFEHVEIQLAQVLHQRISLNSRFPEGDIIRIATEVLNCLVYLQKYDITIGNIEPCTIFHDTNENCIKMYDTTLILGEYPVYKMAKSQFQGRKPYYTPEVIYVLTFDQEEVLSKYKFQSDIFQLGLTLLELCSFQDSTQLFDTDKKKINTQEMNLRLQNICPTYSHKLQQVIKSMLNLDPRKRPSAQDLLIQMHSSTIQPAATPAPFQSISQNSQTQQNLKRAQTPNPSAHYLNQQVPNSPNIVQRSNNVHSRSVSPVSPIIKQRSTQFEQFTQRNPSQIVFHQQQENGIQNYSSNIQLDNSGSHNNSFITYTNSNNQSFQNNKNNNSSDVSFKQIQQIPHNQTASQTQIYHSQIIQQQIPTQKVRFDERSIIPSSQIQNYYKPNYRNTNSFVTQSKSQNVSPVRNASSNESFVMHNNHIPNQKSNLSIASLLQYKQEYFNTHKMTNQKNKGHLFESKQSECKEINNQQSRFALADKTNQYSQRNNVISKASPFQKQNSNNYISFANNETSISNNSSFVQHIQNPSYYFFQSSSNQPNNENNFDLNNKSKKESNYFQQNNNNISNNYSSNNINLSNQNDCQPLNENSFILHQKQYQAQQNNNQYKQAISPSPILSKIINPVNQRIVNPIPKITVITSTQQRSLSPIVGRITKPPILLSPQIQITPVIPSVMTNFNSPIHQLNKIKLQPHIQSPLASDLIIPQSLAQHITFNPVSQFENNSQNQEKLIKLIDMQQQQVINEESDKQSIASFSHPQQFIQSPINQAQQECDKNEQYIERYTFNELGSTPTNSDQQQNYYQNGNYDEFVQTGGDLQNNKYKKQTEMNLFKFFDQPEKIDPELTAMASPTSSNIPQFPQYNNSQLNPQYFNKQSEQQSENQYFDQDRQKLNDLNDHGNYDNYEENQFQLSNLQNQKQDQAVQRIQNKLNQMGNLEERLQNLIQKNYQIQQND
ncbi:hypothetical protein ABPG72_017079 [Tetrahymena utriculariae]